MSDTAALVTAIMATLTANVAALTALITVTLVKLLAALRAAKAALRTTLAKQLTDRLYNNMTRKKPSLVRLRLRSNSLKAVLYLVKALLRTANNGRTRTLLRKLNTIINRVAPDKTPRRRHLAVLRLINLAVPNSQNKDGHRTHRNHATTGDTRLKIHDRITRSNSSNFAYRGNPSCLP